MVALRALSERPELVVDDRGRPVVDPVPTQVGFPGPLGRNRLVAALPLNKSGHMPVQLEPWRALVDDRGLMIGDSAGTVLGTAAVFVHRLVSATRSPQTRR